MPNRQLGADVLSLIGNGRQWLYDEIKTGFPRLCRQKWMLVVEQVVANQEEQATWFARLADSCPVLVRTSRVTFDVKEAGSSIS